MSQDFDSKDIKVETPEVPMKGHKFLIYCLIWLWVMDSIDYTVESFQRGGAAFVLIGIGFLIAGASLVKVWDDLRKWKKQAPKELAIAFIVLACFHVAMILIRFESESRLRPRDIAFTIANAASALFYRKYYNVRDAYFVN